MPRFTISTYDAKPSYGGGYSIALNIGGGGPLPDKRIDAKTTEAALAALAAHVAEIAKLDKPLAASIRVQTGERAPRGWRALKQRDTTTPVNVPGVA